MNAKLIKNDIYWVGVQNPDLRVFDVIMRTEWGTSYNSYLVKGSEKTAIIDPVKEGYAEEHISKISSVVDPSTVDYIICNHTEPDHSGSLRYLLSVCPKATVVCSRPASMFLQNIVNQPFECKVVGEGDSISLGDKTLKFLSVPYLHWPDSIFTYAVEDQVLFSGDVFGFHFSAEQVFDDLTPLSDEMQQSQKYYFDVIMSPFKSYVLDAVEKVRKLDISVIGPSHGPVLRSTPWDAVDRYEKWSEDVRIVNDPKKIYVCYVSCYGYTRQLAEQIYEAAVKSGFIAEIDNIAEVGVQVAAAKIHEADAVAIGSPTLNRDVLKPVWDVLTSLGAYAVRGKKAAAFGSFGWSGEAVKYIAERLKNLGFSVVDSASAKLRPNEEELKKAYDLGERLAASLKQ